MKKTIYLAVWYTACMIFCCLFSFAQQNNRIVNAGAGFLLLSPDARNAGVAEAGTGLPTDANSLFINAAKSLFGEKMGISVSYTPWMRELTKDSHLGYISAYRHLNNREALGIALKYLDLGAINFRNESGELLEQYNANEFAIDISYARKFGEYFGMALTGRYFQSDIGSGTYNSLLLKRTDAFAVDISLYSDKEFQSGKYGKRFGWGLALSNIGTKLKYNEVKTTFMPMNLRIGAGYSLFATPENRLTLLLDVNKLMVPTPPQYRLDQDGNPTTTIEKGKDPDRSVANSLITSLFDAPGGFKEEMSEFSIAGGLEFSYYDQLFIRAGYFYEDPEKGNRQHFAAGIGFNANPIRVDISYVFPSAERYVMRNTMKLTLSYAPMLSRLQKK
ncbi:type IX secretion system outer membrane channel protein PorV [Pedobacter nyackensis]|uniref:type IX secretion system outer membrane channel protein PorV n=1 Tax=Pedobacter nyackensis TaxID=475255 RepID=UPI00292FA3F0|nr:type IX secretion system outer membrane channel protein PorV [Pedobacter nyackensis]